MYIPAHFNQTDEKDILYYLNKYPFGILITNIYNLPYATHVPFTIEKNCSDYILNSHLSKDNLHSHHIEGENALFIVQGPHSYISIRNYPSQQNVPTWNYIAVHLYGKIEIVTDEELANRHMNDLLKKNEMDAFVQWQNADPVYRRSMMKRIVPFQLYVTKIQCKEKLSQNRTEQEQMSIITNLLKTRDSNKRAIAKYMIFNLRKLGKV